MKTLLLASLALLSVSAWSARECQGDIVVPSYSCINPDPGTDIRLNIMEFQTCVKGEITEFDRTVSVINFSNSGDELQNIEVQYQDSRSYYDRAARVDDLTFIKPVSVTALDGNKTIELTMTNRLQRMFDQYSEKHMPGSFVIKSASGKVIKRGRLTCSIFH